MSLEDLKKLSNQQESFDTLPKTFNATIRKVKIGTDPKTDAQCLYLVCERDNGKMITQKLKPMHIDMLLKLFIKNNVRGLDTVLDEAWEFEKHQFTIGFPRWLPTKRLKGKEI